MNKIFISRQINFQSPIHRAIPNGNIVDQSLIDFNPIRFETPQSDWIFFYSRNGVKYFFEQGRYHLFPYLWACMSKGTADALSEYVTDPSFIGEGSPEKIAASFSKVRRDEETVCFIRAENSIDSIQRLVDNTNDFSVPAYSNSPCQNIPEGNFDILIFTSSMNAQTWFNQRSYQDEKVIAIGSTTASTLKRLGINNVITAEEPSEVGLAKTLTRLA